MPVDGKDNPPPTEDQLTNLMLTHITPKDGFGRILPWDYWEGQLVRAVVKQMMVVAEVRLK